MEVLSKETGQPVQASESEQIPLFDESQNTVDDLPKEDESTIIVPKSVLAIINSAPSGVDILTTAINVAVFLCEKNISYGNSAIDPVRIFSKASPIEQIKVRIDDKLSRIIRGEKYQNDDDYRDLLGYLMLYFVALNHDSDASGK